MSNKIIFVLLLVSLFALCGCTEAQTVAPEMAENDRQRNEQKAEIITKIKNPGEVVHVLVALCDNENQGIVPVPAFLGNGEDASKNLYWGAAFGVKTFFSKSKNWEKVAEFTAPQENILQRVVFRHKTQSVWLVADAYRGSKMRETIDDFFAAVAGAKRENVKVNDVVLQISGSANLVAFVGHNGLMDFDLTTEPVKKDDDERDAIILACASRNYFAKPLKKTSANPLLWTTI